VGFRSFNLDPSIAACVEAQGFTAPTPIQLKSIPPALAGRDVMGLAQTGTGKTAAFVLPSLQRLLAGERGRLRMLIIAPTRELVEQINGVIIELGEKTGLRSATIYGGVDIRPQIKKLQRGVDIVVACPGRLLDHIRQSNISLKAIEILVLDEADQMFDMGFLPDIRRILKHLPADRQTLFFAATMPSDIRRLADEILQKPTVVEVAHTAPIETVSHALYPVAAHLKTPLVLELLERISRESVLIFTRTKHRAKRVAQQLTRAGHATASLQGNLSQNRRQAALNGFRNGEFRVLVATDIAARGIDVSTISHVINYDMPATAETYTHRIGRTGRAAKSGDAFTLVTGEDAGMVRTIERLLRAKLERVTLDGFDYKAAAPARDTEFAREPRAPRHNAPRRNFQGDRERPAHQGQERRHFRTDGGQSSEPRGRRDSRPAEPRAPQAGPASSKSRTFRPRRASSHVMAFQ
jgi:ATP-dependent RNA helicase RhlE